MRGLTMLVSVCCRPYPLEGVKPPSRDVTLKVVHQLKEAGLNVLCEVKDTSAVSSR
jgi:hypothetical protein